MESTIIDVLNVKEGLIADTRSVPITDTVGSIYTIGQVLLVVVLILGVLGGMIWYGTHE